MPNITKSCDIGLRRLTSEDMHTKKDVEFLEKHSRGRIQSSRRRHVGETSAPTPIDHATTNPDDPPPFDDAATNPDDPPPDNLPTAPAARGKTGGRQKGSTDMGPESDKLLRDLAHPIIYKKKTPSVYTTEHIKNGFTLVGRSFPATF